MKLTEILDPSCIAAKLPATDKNTAITMLVDLLSQNGQISDRDQVLTAVLEREATRSTGIGDGLAVPHGKSRGCSRLVMALGCPVEPIEFDSADGKPVDLIVLLASPPEQTGPHIQALARVSRLMLSTEFRDQLRHAETPEAAYKIIAEHE